MLKAIKRPKITTPLNGGFVLGRAWQNAHQTIPHEYPIRLNAKGSVLAYGADDVVMTDVNHQIYTPADDDGYCYFVDDVGNPLSHGNVWTYYYQSTRLKKSYADENKTLVNDNPIMLDELGRAKIYISGNYRLRVYDKNGVCLGDDDNFHEFEKRKYDKFLTSRTYPTFKKVDIKYTSKKYPVWQQQTKILTSRKYPNWVKVNKYFTSKPYAYIFDDVLNVNQSILMNGVIVDIPHPKDVLVFKTTFVGGQLKSIYQNHAISDNIKFKTSFIGGQLKSIFITHDMGHDVLNVKTTFVGGDLSNIKIVHDIDTDVIKLKTTFKGGTYE